MKTSEIYDALANIYCSPYPDKPDDRERAQKFLIGYLKENPEMSSTLKPQLELLMQRQKNMKVKFSSIILDKYWEKEYVKKINVRRYNANQI